MCSAGSNRAARTGGRTSTSSPTGRPTKRSPTPSPTVELVLGTDRAPPRRSTTRRRSPSAPSQGRPLPAGSIVDRPDVDDRVLPRRAGASVRGEEPPPAAAAGDDARPGPRVPRRPDRRRTQRARRPVRHLPGHLRAAAQRLRPRRGQAGQAPRRRRRRRRDRRGDRGADPGPAALPEAGGVPHRPVVVVRRRARGVRRRHRRSDPGADPATPDHRGRPARCGPIGPTRSSRPSPTRWPAGTASTPATSPTSSASTTTAAEAQLAEVAFQTPAGEWDLAAHYLAGDVVGKLDEALDRGDGRSPASTATSTPCAPCNRRR